MRSNRRGPTLARVQELSQLEQIGRLYCMLPRDVAITADHLDVCDAQLEMRVSLVGNVDGSEMVIVSRDTEEHACRTSRTNSTTPSALYAHALRGWKRGDAVSGPSTVPPSPSITRRATTSTRSHSRSSANPSASRRAASASLGSSSNACWKHLDARVGFGGDATSE